MNTSPNQPPQWNTPQRVPYQPPQRNNQPPYPPYPLPPSQQRRSGLWSWYKRQTRGAKIGIGCAVIIGLLLFCSCVSAALGSNTAKTTATATPTIASSAAPAAVSSPRTPLQPTPTHNPYQAPPPTPVPALHPTSVPTHPIPTPAPKPTANPAPPCQAVNSNPWCYNLTPGSLIYIPPGNFCDYFNCIPSFWDHTNGYVDECADGTYSHSGGVRGACSYHGGEQQPLYAH